MDIDLLLFDFPSRSADELNTFETEREVPEFKRSGDIEEEQTADPELIRNFIQSDPFSQKDTFKEPIVHQPPVTEESVSEAPSPRVARQQELIDKFVSNTEPRVIRPDDERQDSTDYSVSSQHEDDDLLTETLVRIYVQQKKYEKAIQAYEKLSLKFPEKSIYFASQIEYIKELIKNQ